MNKVEIMSAIDTFYQIVDRNRDNVTAGEFKQINAALARLLELTAYQDRLDDRWNTFINEQNDRYVKSETALNRVCARIADATKGMSICDSLVCPHDTHCNECDYECESAEAWKEWSYKC